ncbi:GNAT family N-acetyltransferase [Tepidibacter aestuarii]|uniref:GNAT family N-acetyltransferase n=1 Tax=Tepidibacter aestuarii TaxID=2925782 RepID=UPI0020C0790D|nr:GNAT family N-acetyltransferase [Tepidibacter aestuarii]CAH2213238.1 putative acetyltransferase [Tepidibacter aestuarii]
MSIRNYESKDCQEVIKLFYETVHSINSKDYTEKQLNVWAPKDIDLWDKSFLKNYTIVFAINDTIVGFGDLSLSGYLDRLFVHKNYQKQGIAKEIVEELEMYAKNIGLTIITTQASITAKPFFEKQGYHVIKEQQIERKGQFLINYKMEKYIRN